MRTPRTYGEVLEAIVEAIETEDEEEQRQILESAKRGIQDLKRGEEPPLAGRVR